MLAWRGGAGGADAAVGAAEPADGLRLRAAERHGDLRHPESERCARDDGSGVEPAVWRGGMVCAQLLQHP